MGYSIVSLAREGISTGLAYEEYSGRFFSNNATPAGFLEVPGIVDAEERKKIKRDWYEQYGGVSKSQLIGIIGQGMKFNPLSLNARDSQFLESKRFQVEEVCRWLNVPPHWIYDLERSTNNNIEQQSLEVVIYTIRPWCVRVEQAIQLKLVKEKNISAEHRLEGLFRGDQAARTAYYIAGRQWGWLSINNILELENMELIEGGDERLTPMNMQKVGNPTNGKDKQMEKLIADTLKKKESQVKT
jgi:HK97 family phage portal protein